MQDDCNEATHSLYWQLMNDAQAFIRRVNNITHFNPNYLSSLPWDWAKIL